MAGPLESTKNYIVAGFNYSDPSIGTMAALYFTETLADRTNVHTGVLEAGKVEDPNT